MPEYSLLGFAAKLTAITVALETGRHHALEEAAKLVETEAKRVIGTYDYGWPELADATKEDRNRKGYADNEPLLRDGALRDSIEHKVVSREEAQIGSDSDVAVAQELGTATIPPRSFLAGAAAHKEKEVVEILGHHTVRAFTH